MALPFAADLATILSVDEFAVTATRWGANLIGQSTVVGIFDNETVPVDAGGFVPVHQEQPRFTCRTADVDGIAEGDTLFVSGVEYTIRAWVHDGTGVTAIRLEKA